MTPVTAEKFARYSVTGWAYAQEVQKHAPPEHFLRKCGMLLHV
jgi:hypothetical protein